MPRNMLCNCVIVGMITLPFITVTVLSLVNSPFFKKLPLKVKTKHSNGLHWGYWYVCFKRNT